jgi:hypothetical protein
MNNTKFLREFGRLFLAVCVFSLMGCGTIDGVVGGFARGVEQDWHKLQKKGASAPSAVAAVPSMEAKTENLPPDEKDLIVDRRTCPSIQEFVRMTGVESLTPQIKKALEKCLMLDIQSGVSHKAPLVNKKPHHHKKR